MTNHIGSFGYAIDFLDRRQLGELLVSARRRKIQRTYAFGDQVQGVPLFGVLLHEHQVQGVEHRPGHVPVEAVGLAVEHIGIGQQPAQARGDGLALVGGDARLAKDPSGTAPELSFTVTTEDGNERTYTLDRDDG